MVFGQNFIFKPQRVSFKLKHKVSWRSMWHRYDVVNRSKTTK